MALAIGAVLLQAQPEDDRDIIHTVDSGDTLISIAHAYGVTLDQLLSLNELHPEALLQIGQRLLVIRAPAFAEAADGEPAPESGESGESSESAELVGGDVASGDLPPAPVAEADAPMRDPADIRPQLCFTVFEDHNQNGLMEPNERPLTNAAIRVLDTADVEQLRYMTDGAAEPYCERRLERALYTIEGSAPPGFGMTSAARLRIDLRNGGLVKLEFGARRDLETASVPPPAGDMGGDDRMSESPRSLLRELSGLFALGLAAVVFFSGMAVSLFIWWR
ncbi:MAG: LysM domain-containing protein [Chloroflexi bacterium]|nr:LysM domain-containing protein [Chloroflexota bacterium]